MKYEYECDKCGLRVTAQRDVERRNDFPECVNCNMLMRRVFSIPIINADLVADRPENKYAFGFSEKDRLKTLLQGDKEYDNEMKKAEYRLKYEGAFKADKPKSLDDIYIESGIDPCRSN